MAKGDKHKVIILPIDFDNANYADPRNCALARAMKRHFKTEEAGCCAWRAHINARATNFKIENDFTHAQYLKAEKSKKPYKVILIEQE